MADGNFAFALFLEGFARRAHAGEIAIERRAGHPAHQRGVHADAAARKFHRHMAGHVRQAGLGHGIAAFTAMRLARCQRRDIDDRARFLRAHLRDHRLRHAQTAERVDVERLRDIVDLGDLQIGPGRVEIGRIDEAIDAPERGQRLRGKVAALRRVGHIGGHGNRFAAGGLDIGDDRFDGGDAARRHGDLGAFQRRTATHRLPHAGAGTGDDDDLVFQDHGLASPCRYGAV